MRLSLLALVSSVLAYALAQDTSLVEVKRAFDNANIPGDINLRFEPKALLAVTFRQSAVKTITLKAGIHLPRHATAGPPMFSLVTAAGRGPYVIAAVDLDAPTPQTRTSAQIRLFLGGNFAFHSWEAPLILEMRNRTPAITEFKQPSPPAGSDPHRCVFLIFDQSKAFNRQTLVNSTTSIVNFSIGDFAKAIDLGQPIGGTFMLVGP